MFHKFINILLDNFFLSALPILRNRCHDISMSTVDPRCGVTIKYITTPSTSRDHGVLCQPGTIFLCSSTARVFNRLHRRTCIVQHRYDTFDICTSLMCAFENNQVTLVLNTFASESFVSKYT